mmetsp:Transcript_62956/g.150116  ORF Transcript_62956/g.150116 Transcript_62956/m.150116 type:complete len:253 (-) Transcript_62956:334-1092(-)
MRCFVGHLAEALARTTEGVVLAEAQRSVDRRRDRGLEGLGAHRLEVGARRSHGARPRSVVSLGSRRPDVCLEVYDLRLEPLPLRVVDDDNLAKLGLERDRPRLQHLLMLLGLIELDEKRVLLCRKPKEILLPLLHQHHLRFEAVLQDLHPVVEHVHPPRVLQRVHLGLALVVKETVLHLHLLHHRVVHHLGRELEGVQRRVVLGVGNGEGLPEGLVLRLQGGVVLSGLRLLDEFAEGYCRCFQVLHLEEGGL